MEYGFLKQLDEFFAEQYSDYVRITAIEGYCMPEMIVVSSDGNISRKDSKYLRICHQREWEKVLANFKSGLADTEYTFGFSFPPLTERVRDVFRKHTFAKLLPAVLKKYEETPESVGQKLALEPEIWQGIVKGKFYPEKNTVMAVALVSRMQTTDVNNLLAACGYSLRSDSVRDVVFEYLLMQKIFNAEMREKCLAEYRIDTIPIAEGA